MRAEVRRERGDDRDDRPRLFVAVPLPGGTVERVRALVESLPKPPEGQRPVRWVRLDGLHLTLRFLGETPVDRVDGLASAVDAVARGTAPFPVAIGGGGAFPGHGRPRTLWLGVVLGADRLAGLAADLDRELAARGWLPEERPYRAHLTLARSDGVRAGASTAAALIEAAAGFEAGFEALSIVLFRSRTGGGPARYEPVHEAALAG